MPALQNLETLSVTASLDVSRQHVESTWLTLRKFFQPQSLAMETPFFPWQPWLTLSTSIQEPPFATACHTKPSQFVASHASHSVCLVQFLPLTTPVLVKAQHCSCSIKMTNEDSLNHAACKWSDTILANFTEPNCPSKLRQWLPPSSVEKERTSVVSIPSLGGSCAGCPWTFYWAPAAAAAARGRGKGRGTGTAEEREVESGGQGEGIAHMDDMWMKCGHRTWANVSMDEMYEADETILLYVSNFFACRTVTVHPTLSRSMPWRSVPITCLSGCPDQSVLGTSPWWLS